MKSSLISIISPVRNGSQYLPECLDSIIRQTADHWELCIVDDHSTDDTWEILVEYSQRDSRIKPFKSTGKGIIHALRTGYQQSTGQYITRMDADDMMLPQKLATMVESLQQSGSGYLAVGGVRYFSDHPLGDGYQKYATWLNNMTTSGSNWSDRYKECVIPSPCWMLSRQDFETCGAFDSDRYPEDYDLTFRMYESGLKIIPCDIVLHMWRDHPSRSSRNDPNYADNRFLELKLFWFNRLELQSGMRPVIWGAGKKGKFIAKYFTEHHISFDWITENERKIGHNIYGEILQSPDQVTTEGKVILIAVANPEEQTQIVASIGVVGEWFLFC